MLRTRTAENATIENKHTSHEKSMFLGFCMFLCVFLIVFRFLRKPEKRQNWPQGPPSGPQKQQKPTKTRKGRSSPLYFL